MKSIFLSCLLLVSLGFSFDRQDDKAKQILDEVSQKTRAYKSISADFIFSMENKMMAINEKNEGSIKLKGQKYVVNLPEIDIKIYSDGKTLWNYMGNGNQVTISNIEDGGSNLMDPSAVFTIYEQGFRSKFIGENKSASGVNYEIELYPDSNELEVTKIQLFIGKADKMIKSAKLSGTDGNTYGIEIKKMETGSDLPDSFFVFNPADYKDVEIIDFR